MAEQGQEFFEFVSSGFDNKMNTGFPRFPRTGNYKQHVQHGQQQQQQQQYPQYPQYPQYQQTHGQAAVVERYQTNSANSSLATSSHDGSVSTKHSTFNHSYDYNASVTSVSSDSGSNEFHGRQTNKVLLDVLRRPFIDEVRLAAVIDTCLPTMDGVNLATLLFHAGKRRLYLGREIIMRISSRFASLNTSLGSREVANALYGMRGMSSTNYEVRELIVSIANNAVVSSAMFSAQAVGNALYGCQLMDSEYKEVRYLLHVLAKKISGCSETLESQNIGNALYGMRNMLSEHAEVREVLAALTILINRSHLPLNGQSLGNSLYGMQGMSSSEPEVQLLLLALARKIRQMPMEILNSQEIGNMLYGMKRMSSDVPEVRTLLEAVIPLIHISSHPLDVQAIGNGFYGMQNFKSDNAVVCSLLDVLCRKLSASSATVDGQAMGNSIYGLKSMSSDQLVVRNIITALINLASTGTTTMNAQELCNGTYGLQTMTGKYSEPRAVVLFFARRIGHSRCKFSFQDISNAMYGLQNMMWGNTVSYMVVNLYSKLLTVTAPLEARYLACMVYGMQAVRHPCPEIYDVIVFLAHRFQEMNRDLTSAEFAYIFCGLKGLSYVEPAVISFVQVLVPLLVQCTEEFCTENFCIMLYGLSSFVEVQAPASSFVLLDALSAKIMESSDTFRDPGLLSAAYFGLQGISCSTLEGEAFVSTFAQQVSMRSLPPAELCFMSATDIANAALGFNRMNLRSNQGARLLLANLVLHARQMIKANKLFSVQECCNVLYGFQRSDTKYDPNLVTLLTLVDNSVSAYLANLDLTLLAVDADISNQSANKYIQEIVVLYRILSLHVSDTTSKGQEEEDTVPSSSSHSVDHESSVDKQDITEGSIADTAEFDTILTTLRSHLSKLRNFLDYLIKPPEVSNEFDLILINNRLDFFPQLWHQTSSAVNSIFELLRNQYDNEMFTITCGNIVDGFNCGCLIWWNSNYLAPDLDIMYGKNNHVNEVNAVDQRNNAIWWPVCNVEVMEKHYQNPWFARFTECRNQYFEDVLKIFVLEIPELTSAPPQEPAENESGFYYERAQGHVHQQHEGTSNSGSTDHAASVVSSEECSLRKQEQIIFWLNDNCQKLVAKLRAAIDAGEADKPKFQYGVPPGLENEALKLKVLPAIQPTDGFVDVDQLRGVGWLGPSKKPFCELQPSRVHIKSRKMTQPDSHGGTRGGNNNVRQQQRAERGGRGGGGGGMKQQHPPQQQALGNYAVPRAENERYNFEPTKLNEIYTMNAGSGSVDTTGFSNNSSQMQALLPGDTGVPVQSKNNGSLAGYEHQRHGGFSDSGKFNQQQPQTGGRGSMNYNLPQPPQRQQQRHYQQDWGQSQHQQQRQHQPYQQQHKRNYQQLSQQQASQQQYHSHQQIQQNNMSHMLQQQQYQQQAVHHHAQYHAQQQHRNPSDHDSFTELCSSHKTPGPQSQL